MRIKKKDLIFEERIKSNMPIPKEVKQLYDLFKKNGYELYVVGGAVRDTLLGNPIKDYDLATDALPNVVETMLQKVGIKTIGTGAAFGVINAYIDDEEYEIATFRADSKESDGRRPDSVTFTDIATDVLRRDLTINALFYDIATGEIVDLVGGVDDIKNNVIRTVGEPEDRFEEDRLRILRAIRFAARVGSKLDPEIDKSLLKNSSLEGVSNERIRDEFIKGIRTAKSVRFFLSLIDRYNLFDSIFGRLEPINKNFAESNNEIVVISKLLSDVNYESIPKALNKLTHSSSEIKQIFFLVSFYQLFSKETFYNLKKLHAGSNVDDETFLEFGKEMGISLELINEFIDFELTIKGDYIMNKFNVKGPEVGEKIKELETKLFFSA